MSIGVPIIESYGMTETTGPQTTNLVSQWRLGSVGRPFIGTHIKIETPNQNEDGEGEVSVLICCKRLSISIILAAIVSNLCSITFYSVLIPLFSHCL